MGTGNSAVVFYVTHQGSTLAHRLCALYPGLKVSKFTKRAVESAWHERRLLIFVMATGIVVRTLAPLLGNKKSDPAVVVLDDRGSFVISLLSGHLGGANQRAQEIANFIGGRAVITTASDVNGLTSLDTWALANDLVIDQPSMLPAICTRLVNRRGLSVYSDIELDLPREFVKVTRPSSAHLLVTNRKRLTHQRKLYLRPKNIVLGLGCNRATSAMEIEDSVQKVIDEHNLSFSSVRAIATIDKKADEPGIRSFCEKHSFPIFSFPAEALNSVPGVSPSEAAFKATGARAVAEPAALLGAGTEKLLVPKHKRGNVTVAAAQIEIRLTRDMEREPDSVWSGKIYVVGTGPGALEHITPNAQQAIRASDVIVGYGTYLDLIGELITDKEVVRTGMTQEIDRCRRAVELALRGKTVAVISGGDPGIYAMAGLVFQVLKERPREASQPRVEIVPGISALNACAAKLGAPLMHDFASISLSDRLTPWKLIEQRLDAAAMADFVIVLYNPRSKGREGHIGTAREILMKHRAPDTPVGIVRGAMRADETVTITDLQHMLAHTIDMQTTVIVGNSHTIVWDHWLITPRGYEKRLKS